MKAGELSLVVSIAVVVGGSAGIGTGMWRAGIPTGKRDPGAGRQGHLEKYLHKPQLSEGAVAHWIINAGKEEVPHGSEVLLTPHYPKTTDLIFTSSPSNVPCWHELTTARQLELHIKRPNTNAGGSTSVHWVILRKVAP